MLPNGEQGDPKLLVTLVWDGAGRNVLDQWPDDWPFLASLIQRGVWYDAAEIGSSALEQAADGGRSARAPSRAVTG